MKASTPPPPPAPEDQKRVPTPTATVSPPPPPAVAAPTPPPSAAPPTPEVYRAPAPSRTWRLGEKITARFPTARLDYARERRLKVTVSPLEMKKAALFVRDILGFDHLEVAGGTDYPQRNEFEVIYFIGSVSTAGQEDLVIQLAERVNRDRPRVASLVEVWTGAEYHERETFDMLGIIFEGHPDLRRILLPEDWNDIPPLRKDFTNPGH